MSRKTVAGCLGLGVFALLVVGLLPAEELAITTSCEVEGLLPRLRASLQGDRFWDGQLRHLDARVQWLIDEPLQKARAEADLAEVVAEADAFLEEMYEKYPETRPSPVERAATALREEADMLEQGEVDALWEKVRLETIDSLQACRPFIVARLET